MNEIDSIVINELVSKKRIAIEPGRAEPHVLRTYYANGTLSNGEFYQVSREHFAKYGARSTYGVEADSQTIQMIDSLFKNRAIKELSVHPNEIMVTLRDMFYWHEAHDDVIDAIMARLGWLKDETDIMSLNDFKLLANAVNSASIPLDKLAPQPTSSRLYNGEEEFEEEE